MGLRFMLCLFVWVGMLPAQTIRFSDTHRTMGSTFRIVSHAPDSALAQSAAAKAWARIDQMNAVLSDYDPESELFQLNTRPGPPAWTPVSKDLFRALQYGKRLARQTNGAFDPTIGPVSKLWRRAFNQATLPPDTALQAAIGKVGYRHIGLDRLRRRVKLRLPGMRVDPGAFVKGWAAQEAVRILAREGLRASLVDAGGDLALGAPPPGQKGWQIDAPFVQDDTLAYRPLILAKAGVATSGDAFRYLELGGKRYSHIADPRTGKGTTHAASVTVVAKTGLKADAFATALSVLPPDEALRFAKMKRVAACWVIRTDTGLAYLENNRFRRLVQQSAP